MAKVQDVCVSRRKGERKTPVTRIVLVADSGIEGDAHAGSARQVSLLSLDAVSLMRQNLPTIGPGDFAENIVVDGLETLDVAVGRRLRLGETVEVTVTAIGKTCHDAGCAIKRAVGVCVMPKEGVFVRVDAGGEVKPGDEVRQG